MIVGIPREVKPQEFRVAATSGAVRRRNHGNPTNLGEAGNAKGGGG